MSSPEPVTTAEQFRQGAAWEQQFDRRQGDALHAALRYMELCGTRGLDMSAADVVKVAKLFAKFLNG